MNDIKFEYYNVVDKVGIESVDDIINIYLPVGIKKEDVSGDLEFIKKLIFTVDVAKRKSLELKDNTYKNRTNEWPIYSEMWLVKDYLSRGLYNDVEKKYLINSGGKINWKKTLKNKTIIANDNIFYPNIIYEKNSTQKNIITELHKYCLNESKFGKCLFNVSNIEFNLNILIDESNKEYYLNILKKELSSSFEDHKKLLLSSMIDIISNETSDNDKKINSFVTNEYDHAWEAMISYIFKDNESLKKQLLPKSKYYLNDSEKPKENSALRPDTIFINKEKSALYIIDSKYYYDSLPQTSDIAKQVQYCRSAIYNLSDNLVKKIYNSFVLPCKIENDSFMKNVGYAILDDKNEDNYRINVVYADTKKVIDTYYASSTIEEIEELTKNATNYNPHKI